MYPLQWCAADGVSERSRCFRRPTIGFLRKSGDIPRGDPRIRGDRGAINNTQLGEPMETHDVNPTDLTPPPPPSPAPRATRFGGVGRRAALGVTAVGLLTGGALGGYVASHAATTTPAARNGARTGS